MPNPVLYQHTTYTGKQEINPILCTASLIGCLVLPRDGSYSVVLKNGKMSHDAIAYKPTKHNWLVIAENGRFPTDYHISMQGTAQQHVKDDYTNDIMMVNPDDQNEIAFAQSRFMEIVNRPKIDTESVIDRLQSLYPTIRWIWKGNSIWTVIYNHDDKFPLFEALSDLSNRIRINVMFEPVSGTQRTNVYIKPVYIESGWSQLLNS